MGGHRRGRRYGRICSLFPWHAMRQNGSKTLAQIRVISIRSAAALREFVLGRRPDREPPPMTRSDRASLGSMSERHTHAPRLRPCEMAEARAEKKGTPGTFSVRESRVMV